MTEVLQYFIARIGKVDGDIDIAISPENAAMLRRKPDGRVQLDAYAGDVLLVLMNIGREERRASQNFGSGYIRVQDGAYQDRLNYVIGLSDEAMDDLLSRGDVWQPTIGVAGFLDNRIRVHLITRDEMINPDDVLQNTKRLQSVTSSPDPSNVNLLPSGN